MEQYPRHKFGPFAFNGSRDPNSTHWRVYFRGIKLLEVTTGWHHLALCWRPRTKTLQVYPGWGAWFFYSPWRHPDTCTQFEEPTYGIAIHKDAFWYYWNENYKIMHWPWDWKHYRTSHLKADGTWKHEYSKGPKLKANSALGSSHPFYFAKEDKELLREEYPYHYMLQNGQVQHVMATIIVSEMEWRMRKAMWLPWIHRLHRSIEIEFSDEVGERAGSWKGGCVGCGYQMRPFETPRQTLMRMQRDRKF